MDGLRFLVATTVVRLFLMIMTIFLIEQNKWKFNDRNWQKYHNFNYYILKIVEVSVTAKTLQIDKQLSLWMIIRKQSKRTRAFCSKCTYLVRIPIYKKVTLLTPKKCVNSLKKKKNLIAEIRKMRFWVNFTNI